MAKTKETQPLMKTRPPRHRVATSSPRFLHNPAPGPFPNSIASLKRKIVVAGIPLPEPTSFQYEEGVEKTVLLFWILDYVSVVGLA